MSFLLDTHAFVWSVLEPKRLGEKSPEDASTFHHLPRTEHKDPFDRMLIWQAVRGSHTLINQDSGIRRAYRAHRLATLW